MNRCLSCPERSTCPHYLPGAHCIFTQPARSPAAQRAVIRAHKINIAGTVALIAGLLTAVGLKVA